ncbi:uncharacterized protein BX664DRAFT_388910 [Halteromyces radiatus]|uniref:uncharacterized protein n=1 Tax=Halteromyces radiatus TaxID=101107 RepID=UPI0022209ED2|nr:uncharacterized protein BX664DRAFT_388910 [Halteromyces radiatus]KAI8079962.1 hypothetical protein BX664DRAFT_388910 [Halteromyces radiatus]
MSDTEAITEDVKIENKEDITQTEISSEPLSVIQPVSVDPATSESQQQQQEPLSPSCQEDQELIDITTVKAEDTYIDTSIISSDTTTNNATITPSSTATSTTKIAVTAPDTSTPIITTTTTTTSTANIATELPEPSEGTKHSQPSTTEVHNPITSTSSTQNDSPLPATQGSTTNIKTQENVPVTSTSPTTAKSTTNFEEIQNQLKKTLDHIEQRNMVSGFRTLSKATGAVVDHCEQLGLTSDDHPYNAIDREQFWAGLNNCWLYALAQRHEPSQPEEKMTDQQLRRLREHVVTWADKLERYGLVDYEMGWWEADILAAIDAILASSQAAVVAQAANTLFREETSS